LSSDDEEYLMPNDVAKRRPGQSVRTVRLMTAARLDLLSPPESWKNWGHMNLNLNDDYSDPTENSS